MDGPTRQKTDKETEDFFEQHYRLNGPTRHLQKLNPKAVEYIFFSNAQRTFS